MASGFDNIVANAEGWGGFALAQPGTEPLSAMSAGYHAGSAIYDAFTGDRDGAIGHGVSALYDGVTALPGSHEGLGVIDMATSALGVLGRGIVGLDGGDAADVPVGNADILSGLAVAGTNAIFGPDDSNWIAPGTVPQGTRLGEMTAGGAGLGAVAGMMVGNPLLGAAAGAAGIPLIGTALGANPDGPTSGTRREGGEANGWAQRTGDWLYHQMYD